MKKNLLKITSLFFFLCINVFVFAQHAEWDSTPQKGFVYEINNKEAQKLISKKNKRQDYCYKLLHTLVDTFDIEKGWINRPEKGHFILASIKDNQLQCEYTCVYPYQVFLMKEYDAMSLQVLDFDGNIREDAKVKFKFRRISIDPESKTFRVENEYFSGDGKVLSVEVDSFRSVFFIEKHRLPEYWGGYNYSDNSPSFYSYMITDKNKYKPNDLIRFKSYALSQNKWPLKKDLEIWISGYNLNKKIGVVSPHRPGSYAGEFHINDSLKLTLDKSYNLQLREKKGRIVAGCNFKYEDYELFGNKLDIKLAKNKQYFPEKNQLSITAIDVNGLMLKDAKATIKIETINIQESFEPLSILQNTLMTLDIKLDPKGPTKVDIPAKLFQKTNTPYLITVTVLDSKNERLEKKESATFYYSQYDIDAKFVNDSICFSLFKNGVSIEDTASLIYNEEITKHMISFPHIEKINPAISKYKLNNKLISKTIDMRSMTPKLKLIGGIEKDSFNIQLENPQGIEVSWYVYEGSELKAKGFGKEIDYKSLIENRNYTYSVELLYTFGGREQSKREDYEFKENRLNISLDIPERVYPGQEVDANIKVTNELGNPVRGVDLTAFSFTNKLNYNVPDLPYYGNTSIPRERKATYSKSDLNKYIASYPLNYNKWKGIAGLDSMIYYQLTYPQNGVFKYITEISDSTQFAPYVMRNGAAEEIHVIEIDHQPVYFSWTEQVKKYSFYISPNKNHEISLRLNDTVFVLDSMSFEKGVKTILSYDYNWLVNNSKVIPVPNTLTWQEESRYLPLISSFECVRNNYAFLDSKTEFIPLFERNSGKNEILVGPVQNETKFYVEPQRKLETKYKHTGGYKYAFEDNIVYKLNINEDKYKQFHLSNRSYNPKININDTVLNEDAFIEEQEKKPANYIWSPTIVDVSIPNIRLKILLPEDLKEIGIKTILFENKENKEIFYIYKNEKFIAQSSINKTLVGDYNIMVLYNNGSYLKTENVPMKKDIHVLINFKNSVVHPADNASMLLLNQFLFPVSTTPPPARRTYTINQSVDGNTRGTITDLNDEPLIGVSVVIKGTTNGAVTDFDGKFKLNLEESFATIRISYIGYKTQTIEVERGSDIKVIMEEDALELSEVQVIGFSSGYMRKSDLTGSISSISAGSYSRPAIPDTIEKDENTDNNSTEGEQQLYQELLALNSIRSNFSDVGFWEPRLYTDKLGESNFKVTFPDDISQWNAVVYGMNRYLQTGTARKNIKSYKPIMTELNVPQFLTVGDSAQFIGKVSNYTLDSTILGKVQFNGINTDFEKNIEFSQFYVDKLPINPQTTDSITTSYVFTRNDGYMDGEKRTVPVVEQGIVRADGILGILNNDEEKHIKAPSDNTINIKILDNQIDFYKEEVQYLINYQYACNEQLASKLIGLINHKMLMKYENKDFKYDNDINKIIDRLLKNQNKEFLWSWWNASENSSFWISAHILEALKYAKDAGYEVNLNTENILSKAEYKFEFLKQFSLSDIELLHSLAEWKVETNYTKYINIVDTILTNKEKSTAENARNSNYSLLKEKFLIMELKQMRGLPYERDSLLKYKKENILGEISFSDNKASEYWYNNKLGTNVIAYRIVKNDSTLKDLLFPMQMYFINTRQNNIWNTYQASNIMKNILPDLLAEGYSKKNIVTLSRNGQENETIKDFPYETQIQANEELTMKKESGHPLYYIEYNTERVTEAKTGVEGFEIKTHFSNNRLIQEAGKPVKLIVNVNVKKDAKCEYVMIEIPIPGSCSYANKNTSNSSVETHREYFKEKTVIFCEKMAAGEYTFSVDLLPRFTGSYIINPAQVSLMYIPVINANTNMKRVKIVEK